MVFGPGGSHRGGRGHDWRITAYKEQKARITLPMQEPRCAWCLRKSETRLCTSCAAEVDSGEGS